MNFNWLEIAIFAIFLSIVVSAIFVRGKSWLEPNFWKRTALITSIIMVALLLVLTVDTLSKISMGTDRIPDATVINKKISYVYSDEKHRFVPKIEGQEKFFGKVWSESEAENLLNLGKMTIQSRACMDCHTLLGNGAYYAPDLTKAWLDPKWNLLIKNMVNAKTKEEAMAKWLMNTDKYPTFTRRMPNMHLSEKEAKAVVAYLKWMSAIDTNGFPDNFLSSQK